MTLDERLELRVIKTDKCWIWMGSLNGQGYADIKISGKSHKVHRLMYERHREKIPEGLVIDHLCRNRGCLNPEHMEPVTSEENTRRGLTKDSCGRGHKMSGGNIKMSKGKRECRECNKINSKNWRRKQKKDYLHSPNKKTAESRQFAILFSVR